MIDLNQQLERWLADGIITDEQADMMIHSVLESDAPDRSSRGRRIPLVAEILGYVGAALAIWAILFIVAEQWASLEHWAQAALFGALSFALFAGGRVLLWSEEPAFARLSSVLWAGSVIALGGAMWVLFDPIGGFSVEATGTMIGLGAALVAFAMYRLQRSILQHIALYVSVLVALNFLVTLAADLEVFAYGLLVWGIGLVWALVSRAQLLPPGTLGMTIGAISMFYGAQMISFGSDIEALGIWLGLATAALFAAGGVALQEKPALIIGALGIFWFVPQAMFHFFGETFGGMIGLFLSGLAIVGLAIWFSRDRTRHES